MTTRSTGQSWALDIALPEVDATRIGVFGSA
jgi:hypothetical protein